MEKCYLQLSSLVQKFVRISTYQSKYTCKAGQKMHQLKPDKTKEDEYSNLNYFKKIYFISDYEIFFSL